MYTPTDHYRPSITTGLPSISTISLSTPGRGMGHAAVLDFFRLPSSAYCCLGAGQGRMWGAPTTRNANTAVLVKREAVLKDFGCSLGGIVASGDGCGGRRAAGGGQRG